jgi:hypothetical protein
MRSTHFITIPKEEFDKINMGDRIVIENDKDHFCYIVYVKDNDNEENQM